MASRTELHTARAKALAKLLRKYRDDADLSQRELGVKLNRPASYVTKVEGRQKSVSILEFLRWIEVTGVPVDQAFEELKKI